MELLLDFRMWAKGAIFYSFKFGHLAVQWNAENDIIGMHIYIYEALSYGVEIPSTSYSVALTLPI